jgi:phosphoribosylformylglycinamidine synthase
VLTRAFPGAGYDVILFGDNPGELGGSEYLKVEHGLLRGAPPVLDLARERALQGLLVSLAAKRLIASAHDCAEGGVAVTIAESCFEPHGIGVDVDLPAAASDGGVDRLAATLFGESASRVVVSARPQDTAAVLDAARTAGVPARRIGHTSGAVIRIAVDGQIAIACPLEEAEHLWTTSLEKWLASRAA